MSGILALDPATHTGWAFAEPGCAPVWGVEDLSKGHYVGAQLWKMLTIKIEQFVPRWVVKETAFLPPKTSGGPVQNAKTAERLFGLSMLIDTRVALLRERGLEIDCYQAINTAFIAEFVGRSKKFPGQTSAERRKARKAATMQVCWARGWRAPEDACDALALLMYAEKRLYPVEHKSRAMILKAPSGPLFAKETA